MFLCNFIFWLGCIQHRLYCVSSSLLTLSLDGGVNVYYSHFIRWSTVPLGGFCASLFTVRFFLLNYVVISDLIYVLLCLTATSVCVMCPWRWMSVVWCSCYTVTPDKSNNQVTHRDPMMNEETRNKPDPHEDSIWQPPHDRTSRLSSFSDFCCVL